MNAQTDNRLIIVGNRSIERFHPLISGARLILEDNHMNLLIRSEETTDFETIYNFVKLAFKTASHSDGSEQDFINELRRSPSYIKELALVAEDEKKIIGHIMLTKFQIQGKHQAFETLLLAPLAVDLEYRKCGIGSALVLQSFELAKQMGYESVIVLGDPAYYSRFGFKPSTHFGITCLNEIPFEFIQACELIKGSLTHISGAIQF